MSKAGYDKNGCLNDVIRDSWTKLNVALAKIMQV